MWQSAIALAKEGLKAAVEAGQPTVLLDEPEAGLSLVWQAKLWELLRDPAVAQRYQVIVATHSVFGLDVPGATYVDMATGYREEALAAVRSARLLPEDRSCKYRLVRGLPPGKDDTCCARPPRRKDSRCNSLVTRARLPSSMRPWRTSSAALASM